MKECFLIGAYCNTDERINDLKRCLLNLKKYNLPIIISSHYILPEDIIKSVDGFIYDSANEILYQKDFEEYRTGFWYFFESSEMRIDKAFDFHHDYAFWTQLKNGFSLAKNKGYDIVHFLDFDVELDDETFYELKNGIENYDVCSYPLYDFMYLVVFSCKSDLGLKITESIPTFYDYFYDKPGKTNVEKVFYDYVLKYNAKLNLIPKILIDKPNFQNFNSALNYKNNNYFVDDKKLIAGIFPCCDNLNNLYLHFNIIENNNNLTFYIEYDGNFIKKDYNLLTKLGLLKNKSINVYANGKLFYTKNIDDIDIFKKYNFVYFK